MNCRRVITVCLVALAVAIAPLAVAMAGPHLAALSAVGHTPGSHAVEAAAATDHTAHADMTDCDSRMGGSEHSDCRCCDPGKSCPPEFCAAKCFKIFGVLPLPKRVVGRTVLHQRVAGPLRPPDWSRAPQPPPPRA